MVTHNLKLILNRLLQILNFVLYQLDHPLLVIFMKIYYLLIILSFILPYVSLFMVYLSILNFYHMLQPPLLPLPILLNHLLLLWDNHEIFHIFCHKRIFRNYQLWQTTFSLLQFISSMMSLKTKHLLMQANSLI